MSEKQLKDINKTAFKQAEEELLKKKIDIVKGYIQEVLEKTEQKKKQKEKIEEELRILKLDLDDLRNGKFEKIEERIQKSDVARNISPIIIQQFIEIEKWIKQPMYPPTIPNPWITWTAGTYNTSGGNTFYF